MRKQASPASIAWLVVGAFLCGYVAAHGSVGGPASAAPADLHGGIGVAVTGFHTSAGSYILWSDGHISNAMTGVQVNASPATAGAYTPAPSVVASTFPKTDMTGSPWVAVSSLPTAAATYVLFSNGAVMKPSDTGAAAGNSKGNVRFLCLTSPGYSSGDISTGAISGNALNINFDPAFTSPPLVFGITAGSVGTFSPFVGGGGQAIVGPAYYPIYQFGSTVSSATCSIPATSPFPAFSWVIAIGS